MKTTDHHPDDLIDAVAALRTIADKYGDEFEEMDIHIALDDLMDEADVFIQSKRDAAPSADHGTASGESDLAMRSAHLGR